MYYDEGGADQFKPRGSSRVHIEMDAFLTFDNTVDLPVTIVDLSNNGFCFRSPDALDIGKKVILHVPESGQFVAMVVWQLGKLSGAEFECPLTESTMVSIVLGQFEKKRLNADGSGATGFSSDPRAVIEELVRSLSWDAAPEQRDRLWSLVLLLETSLGPGTRHATPEWDLLGRIKADVSFVVEARSSGEYPPYSLPLADLETLRARLGKPTIGGHTGGFGALKSALLQIMPFRS